MSKEFIQNMNRELAVERLENVVKQSEWFIREVKQYIEKVKEADTDADRAKQMEFAIGYISSNSMNGFRIDLLAQSCSELMRQHFDNLSV